MHFFKTSRSVTAEAQSSFEVRKSLLSAVKQWFWVLQASSSPILIISTGSEWMFSHIQKHLTSSRCCTSWPGSAAVSKERRFKCKCWSYFYLKITQNEKCPDYLLTPRSSRKCMTFFPKLKWNFGGKHSRIFLHLMHVNSAQRRPFLTVQNPDLGSFKGHHTTTADK